MVHRSRFDHPALPSGEGGRSENEIIREFFFVLRFVPLTTESARVLCDAVEAAMQKYPFLQQRMILEEVRSQRKSWAKRVLDEFEQRSDEK